MSNIDNLGDPKGFKIYLMNSGMKKEAVKSARGNRLHLFFRQSELHANYREVFCKYIGSRCPKSIDYLGKLRHDYMLADANDQLQALAIISQMISARLKRFYRDAEAHMEAFVCK